MRRAKLRILSAGALAGLLLLGGSAEARPGAVIALTNGNLPISQLLIGDDLFVTLSEAAPATTYEVQLLAPDGLQIAAEQVTTDAAGVSPPLLLWSRTGVIGCQLCLAADPSIYLFETHGDAAQVLAGQTLTIDVLGPNRNSVASAALTVNGLARELVYFSNAAGCPRQGFNAGEQVYLTFLHPDRSQPKRRIFLPQSAGSWPVGQPVADVRGGFQLVTLPPAGLGAANKVVVPLAGGASLPGGVYDGVTRRQAIDYPVRLEEDTLLANRYVCSRDIRGGIMIVLDDCTNCPPP